MRQPEFQRREAERRSNYIVQRSEKIGKGIGIAVIMGILFHVLLYFALKKVPVLLDHIEQMGKEKKNKPAEIRMVDEPKKKQLHPPKPEALDAPDPKTLEIADQKAELEDILDDITISPEINETALNVEFKQPAMAGDDLSELLKPNEGIDIDLENPLTGVDEQPLDPPTQGDLTVDVGGSAAEIFNPDAYTQDLLKKGVKGQIKDGALKNFSSLEEMKTMNGNALNNAQALIGSDLLFEFGKANLKASARESLLAVAYLIDRNPKLYCILEGHTDSYGSEKANLELSKRRANAVKHWLVHSVFIDKKRIIIQAFGESALLVEGDKNQQAINRRVVIKLRKNPNDPAVQQAATFQQSTPKEKNLPEPVLLKRKKENKKTLPKAVTKKETAKTVEETIPKAIIEEVPKAVIEAIPKAIIEEEVPKVVIEAIPEEENTPSEERNPKEEKISTKEKQTKEKSVEFIAE